MMVAPFGGKRSFSHKGVNAMDYVIGIDGGGTKTLLKIADLQGTTITAAVGGSCNINSSAIGDIAGMLRKILSDTTETSGLKQADCLSICIGTAGAGRVTEQKKFEEIFREAGYRCTLVVTDDARTVLRVGVGHEGIIIISGTGSICMGCRNGKVARAGGWGHIIGDEGSSYAAAIRVFRAVMQAYDGRGPQTVLSHLLAEKYHIGSEEQLVPIIYRQGIDKKELACVSELLKPACEAGDTVARSILYETARELLIHVDAVSRALGLSGHACRLVTSGGLINCNRFFREQFLSLAGGLFPLMHIEKLSGDSADGAVLLALDQLK